MHLQNIFKNSLAQIDSGRTAILSKLKQLDFFWACVAGLPHVALSFLLMESTAPLEYLPTCGGLINQKQQMNFVATSTQTESVLALAQAYSTVHASKGDEQVTQAKHEHCLVQQVSSGAAKALIGGSLACFIPTLPCPDAAAISKCLHAFPNQDTPTIGQPTPMPQVQGDFRSVRNTKESPHIHPAICWHKARAGQAAPLIPSLEAHHLEGATTGDSAQQ
ncbi:unnamed protein product [Ostreobium quekettii]|uniref:Uncharacterized protein n=1 Tax=Ostreobium quekettii TaxID=121088 RepID=A0A8S1IXD0_9CHLO|nr:unnamed protein product [Ostreobium quekettii]